MTAGKTKEFAENEEKPEPQVEERPEAPEKRSGPEFAPPAVTPQVPRTNGAPDIMRAVGMLNSGAALGGGMGRARTSGMLQRSMGNQRVGQLVQRKEDPGAVAPQMAARIGSMRLGGPPSGSPAITRDTEGEIHRMAGGGQPLAPSVRSSMEPRFGEDLSQVRVHTGPDAARVARSLDARAFTVGRDIGFGAGEFRPGTPQGDELIAHELTHVKQQKREGETDLVQRQPLTPSPAPAPGVPVPIPPPPGTTPTPPTGPTIRQGPIGDIEIPLPDWTFFEPRSDSKTWSKGLPRTTLVGPIPIPELLVSVDISGSAEAKAVFTASIGPGILRNIRIGLSYEQAIELLGNAVVASIVAGVAGPGLGAAAHAGLTLSSLSHMDIRGLADLYFPADVGVLFSAKADLEAAAALGGVFNVAKLGAGLAANASATAGLTFGGPVGLYYENFRLRFKFNEGLQARLNLAFNLLAFLRASLLGFNWQKDWVLFSKELGHVWNVGAPLDVDYDNGATVSMAMSEEDKDLLAILKDLFTGAVAIDHPLEDIPPAEGEMSAEQAHNQAIASSRRPELLRGHGSFAPGSETRDFTSEDHNRVDAIGYATGDHSTGNMIPGTITIDPNTDSGKQGKPNWPIDHQPPVSLLGGGAVLQFRFFPHSLSSQRTQGGAVNAYKIAMKRLRNRNDSNWAEGVRSQWFW